MNKRNAAMLAALLAFFITCAVLWLPLVHRSAITGILYIPAIALSILLSGEGHSVKPAAGWVGFLVYTLLYLVVFIVAYVFILEWYLLTRNLERSQSESRTNLKDFPAENGELRHVGRAIQFVERARRRHFILQAESSIDLTEDPTLTAARALTTGVGAKHVKRVIGRLTQQGNADLLSRLRSQAAAVMSAHASTDPERSNSR